MVYDEPDLTIQRSQKRKLRPLLWSFRDRNGCDGAPDADHDPEPEVMDENQKESKVKNLLAQMRKKEIITTDSANQQKSSWILIKDLNK